MHGAKLSVTWPLLTAADDRTSRDTLTIAEPRLLGQLIAHAGQALDVALAEPRAVGGREIAPRIGAGGVYSLTGVQWSLSCSAATPF